MKPRKLVLAPKAVRPKHKPIEERNHRTGDAAPRSVRIHLLS
jgi:hypothetical protein